MSRHELKTWPEYFAAVLDGSKRAELRYDDRGFAVGDVLRLREWDPDEERYSGRECSVTVTHIVQGGAFGLAEGHVMMSIALRTFMESGKRGPGRP